MLPLIEEEKKIIGNKNFVIYVEINLIMIQKVREHCHHTGKYRGTAHLTAHLKCKNANEIPMVLRNESKYDCYLILKQLTKEFEGQLKFLGGNT